MTTAICTFKRRRGPIAEGLVVMTLFVWVLMSSPGRQVGAQSSAQDPSGSSDRIREAYGQLPLGFERNVGQTDKKVEFLARGSGYTLFLNKGAEVVLSLRAARSADGGAVLKLRLAGSNRESSGAGQAELRGKVNYLVGTNPAAWRRGVDLYGEVRYRDVYPGIDILFYGNQRELEYDFIVQPGADPSMIGVEFEGADTIVINDEGELVATIGEREVIQQRPLIYQEVGGATREVPGRYVLVSRTRAAFKVGAYDRERTLVIDPVLVYSTYLDGTLRVGAGSEGGAGIAVDTSGHVYVTGGTNAVEFPTTAGSLDTNWNGGSDVFVSKLDASGSGLVYSTYLGGTASETGRAIVLDADGSAFVTGTTSSDDYPTTRGAFDASWNGGDDVFVTKLDPGGAVLAYSTYLGGNDREICAGIALDGEGGAYVAGTTFSADFPATAEAFDTSLNGANDMFVTKLDPSGAALAYSTYLGGGSYDYNHYALAVDPAGSVYITGDTLSADFPTTAGAFSTTKIGFYWDAVVTKLDSTGATVAYSSYLGGTYNDHGHAIAVDAEGSAYVTGRTENFDFPTTAGAFDTSLNGLIDVFVTKLNASGSALLYSTFLGGGRRDESRAIAVDAGGRAYVTGSTESSTFPTTPGAFDTSWNQSSGPISDVFVTKLDSSGGSLAYSSYLGGSWSDSAFGIAVDGTGGVYVTGSTVSADFPTTAGAFDSTWNDGSDVFVTKIVPSGAELDYSTYLGGTFGGGGAAASGLGIAVDAAGSAYVTGSTASIDFPTTAGAFDSALNGNTDVFVTKLNSSGAELVYSTYLGGSGDEVGTGIAVDLSGSAYVTGYILFFGASSSANFPTTAGAFATRWKGGYYEAFVTKLESDGAALAYSTYLGGSGFDLARGIAVDAFGSAYVTGQTDAFGDFPTTPGAFGTNVNGATDAFITKLNPSGGALEYSTLLGGGSNDFGASIAVDVGGEAYVTGPTDSTNFPTTAGAFDTSSFGGDFFVTKLDRHGAALRYSTYVGGSSSDYSTSIAVDGRGIAYVTGYTASANFPTTPGAFDTSWNGSYDLFVTSLDPNGAALTYATYLGGSGEDRGHGIAVDVTGSVSLTGRTSSADFPTTAGAHSTIWNGSSDAFISKLDTAGAALAYSTYIGGSATDFGSGIALDRRGDVYLVGSTESSDFPTTPGAFDSTADGQSDAFVIKFSFIGGPSVLDALLHRDGFSLR
jgi:hypothetical protein